MKAAGIDSRMFVYTYIYPSSTEIILDDYCVCSERIAGKDPRLCRFLRCQSVNQDIWMGHTYRGLALNNQQYCSVIPIELLWIF